MFSLRSGFSLTPKPVVFRTTLPTPSSEIITEWNRRIIANALNHRFPGNAYDRRLNPSQAVFLASCILCGTTTYQKGSQILDPLKFRDMVAKTSALPVAFNEFTKRIERARIATWSKVAERAMAGIMDCINTLLKKTFSFIFNKQPDISAEISPEFEKMIEDFSPLIKDKLKKKLKGISAEERYFIKYLITHIAHNNFDKVELLTHILNGGFVSIDDEGITYTTWESEMKKKAGRYSSHESSGNNQYAIRGPFVRELLFSKKRVSTEDGGFREETWFQLERFPAKFLYHVPHMGTWFLYKVQQKNQGPYGSSAYTERTPLRVKLNSIPDRES